MSGWTSFDVWQAAPGRRKVRKGDLVRVDDSKARYRVQEVRVTDEGVVEVHVYGGKNGRLRSHIFAPDQVIHCRSRSDPNDGLRVAIREASKAKNRRTRR